MNILNMVINGAKLLSPSPTVNKLIDKTAQFVNENGGNPNAKIIENLMKKNNIEINDINNMIYKYKNSNVGNKIINFAEKFGFNENILNQALNMLDNSQNNQQNNQQNNRQDNKYQNKLNSRKSLDKFK